MKNIIKILFMLGLTASIVAMSPRPVASLLKRSFENRIATYPENYDTYLSQVNVSLDNVYPSKNKNNLYDVYTPKDMNKDTAYPIIIWVHGGAFVGGNKSDLDHYGTILASKGYVVFSINYELAPDAKYPTPINQLTEFYNYLQEKKSEYNIDLSNLFFAGDSAGAQIVGQFINIQTNKNYASKINIKQVVNPKDIRGVLLYCGIYELSDFKDSSSTIKYIFDRIGWAYLGDKKWKNSPKVKELAVTNNISSNFPSVYVTDGNTGSFEAQGKNLVKKFKKLGVNVESRFFDLKETTTSHEYQFILDTEDGMTALNDTINFLEKHKK